jgi:hypothetical protein
MFAAYVQGEFIEHAQFMEDLGDLDVDILGSGLMPSDHVATDVGGGEDSYDSDSSDEDAEGETVGS